MSTNKRKRWWCVAWGKKPDTVTRIAELPGNHPSPEAAAKNYCFGMATADMTAAEFPANPQRMSYRDKMAFYVALEERHEQSKQAQLLEQVANEQALRHLALSVLADNLDALVADGTIGAFSGTPTALAEWLRRKAKENLS